MPSQAPAAKHPGMGSAPALAQEGGLWQSFCLKGPLVLKNLQTPHRRVGLFKATTKVIGLTLFHVLSIFLPRAGPFIWSPSERLKKGKAQVKASFSGCDK